jgi:hypothetical protein
MPGASRFRYYFLQRGCSLFRPPWRRARAKGVEGTTPLASLAKPATQNHVDQSAGLLGAGRRDLSLEKEIPSSPLDKYFLLCSCKDTPSAESPLSSITLRKLAVVQSNKTSRRFLFHCSPDGILFFRQPHRLWPYSFFTVKHLFIFIAYSYSCCFCLSRQPKHATSWMARSQQTTAHAGRTMPTHLVAEHSLPASANQTCALNPADSASQPMA